MKLIGKLVEPVQRTEPVIFFAGKGPSVVEVISYSPRWIVLKIAESARVVRIEDRIARLLEEGAIRSDVATVYALQDAAQAWRDVAGNLPGVHGVSPRAPGAARRRAHGKIVLRVS